MLATQTYASRRRIIPVITPALDALKRAIRPSEVVTTFTPMWTGLQPTYTAWKYDKIVEEAYLKNELIFSCIDKKANTVTNIGMKIYDKASGEHLPDHPLQKLIERPNPHMTQNDLWESVINNLDLAGLAPFQKIFNSRGELIQLWPMRPDKLGFKRSATKFISGYAFRADDGYEYTLEAEQVFYFIQRDPRDMLKPVSRAMIAGRQIDIDNAETDHMKLHWEKGGMPPTVITSKKKLDKDQKQQARDNWDARYGGYQNWHSPVILDDDTTVQMLGYSFKDMGLEIIDGRIETRICMVMRVPPIIVGTAYGLSRSTFSNYAETEKAWWETDLVPFYNKLADQINLDITPLWGDGIIAKWDLGNVNALQTDRNDRWNRAALGYTRGVATRNEARKEANLPELPGEDEFIPTPEKASFGAQTSTADTGTPDGAAKQAAALLEARSRVKRAIEQVKPQGEPLPSDIATEVSEFTAEEIAAGEDRFRQLRHTLRSTQDNA
jgi:HK97 family phage portal protein